MDDWDEVSRATAATQTHLDAPTQVTALAFDTAADLLWVGTDKGRVMSFFGTELQLYTSFRIQPPNEGPVRQFLFHDKGVISLGPKSVHMQMRKGAPKSWSIRDENIRDLHCMSYTSKGTAEILVAGLQDSMFVIDVNKGELTKQVPTEKHYTIMRKSRYICAATPMGAVDMLDAVTLKVVKSWQAHVAYINDMDSQGDFIVTCGGSIKHQATATYMLDPYVNVFDLKNMTSMSPIPFPPLAAYVRMHPRMATTSIVVSQAGQMHVVDLMNPHTTNVRLATVSGYLTLVDIAPSGEALAMADSAAEIQLWGSRSKVRFVDYAVPIDLPDPVEPVTPLDWFLETPLNSVGLPFYREKLLSAMPANLVSVVGAPPQPVDPVLRSTLKPSQWGLWGRMSQGPRMEDARSAETPSEAMQIPKFLSEKARESAKFSLEPPANMRGEKALDQLPSGQEFENSKPEVTPSYRNVEIKYSKFGVDDFDFGYYNKTQYSGLENNVPNSYANSLLQVMHYTPLIRNLALQHAASACLVDPCLLCEIGFVFDMLEKAEGTTCQATNMLKALSSLPQAGALLLLEDEVQGQSCTAMNQGLVRFLLDKISNEYRSIEPASTALEKSLFGLEEPFSLNALLLGVLATEAVNMMKCTNCRVDTSRPSSTFATDMMYPPQKTPIRGSRPTRVTFSQVLKSSVERETTTRGWCGHCQRYMTIQSRRTVQSAPAVLAINAALSNPENKRFWSTPGWLPEEIGIIVDAGQFFCFEGEDLEMHLQRGMHEISVFSLVGVVLNIDSPPPQKPHLVAMVNVSHSDITYPGESRWHLFNDFAVQPVSTSEALTCHANWKMPSTLVYQVKVANNRRNLAWKSQLDTSLLFHDFNPSSDSKTYRVLDPNTEKPGPTSIVALDTEFVSLKQPEMHMTSGGERETIRPMSHALARVSVVRGQGELEGVPFIDDYIAIKEPVVDYLTLYSGITPGDLDPRTSRHHLVGLKAAYKKLWILLNLGCKFLGHGLKQDFRVINIQVPKSQIIDTIELFFLKARLRKLSLAFLAWYLLKEDIQLETHDSIEDARTALKLYRKYLEFEDAGILETMLQDIYRAGRDTSFKPPRKEDQEAGDGHGRPATPARRMVASESSLGQGQVGSSRAVMPTWAPGKGLPPRK